MNITKLERPINGIGCFFEINNQLHYAKGKELKNWYNALSLRRKIELRSQEQIEIPF